MSVTELLARLREENVELSVKGDELVVRGGERALEAPALLAQLRANKRALIDFIRAGHYVPPGTAIQTPPSGIPARCDAITPDMLPLVQLAQEDIDGIADRVTGGVANIQDIYPLAPLQEGIFFHHLVTSDSDGDPYLLQAMCAFETRAQLDAYVDALRRLVLRHDVLRTAVLWEGLPEPVQVVWRNVTLQTEIVPFDPADGDVATQLRERFHPRHCRIDVRRAPLLRLIVTHDVPGARWLMLGLYHHLVIEGSALQTMHGEIVADLQGHAPMRPAAQYRDFVAQARGGVSEREHEAFFREMLGDVEAPTAPFGLVEVRGDGSGIGDARCELDADLTGRLRQVARVSGATMAALCHVAWALVLARVSGNDSAVFGTVLFGRVQGAGDAPLPGMFVNTLPLRLDVGAMEVRRAVQHAQGLLTQLRYHQHASLALAQRCSLVKPPAPLFSALLNYRHAAHARIEAPRASSPARVAVEAAEMPVDIAFLGGVEQRTNYPLVLQIDDDGDSLRIEAMAQAPADPGRVRDYMRTALAALAEALERAPDAPLRSVDILPAAERERMLRTWNATQAAYRDDTFVHTMFAEQARHGADAIALRMGDEAWRYGELNERANRLAHRLRALGVGPDARVALCFERSVDMMVAVLATLKAGGAYVPLDPGYPTERVALMLRDSAPVVVLSHARVPAQTYAAIRLAARERQVPLLDLEADGTQWAREPDTDPVPEGLTPRHLAYVIYTSGSTGRPKGVMVTHGGLTNYLAWAVQAYSPRRAVVSSSLSFDATVTSLLVPLVLGGTVRLLPEGEEIDALQALLCSGAEVGLIKITPAHLEALGQQLRAQGVRSAVDLFVVGGEALAPSTVALWRAIQPGVRIVNEYGPTETVVGCVVHDVAPDWRAESAASVVPIGRPIANTRIYLLDGHGRPVPPGVPGEMHIGGAGVARGYLNRPELTAERFVPDPFSGARDAKMYKTGDLARHRDDGTIEYLGRNDFQIKLRGFRIEPGEIEARLVAYAGVREAAVLLREDADGDRCLAAYYTTDPDRPVDPETLRAHAAAALPAYMVPTFCIRLDAFPLTPNGKLDRTALPAPETVLRAAAGDGGVLQGETEEAIAGIWLEVLKCGAVCRHDDFFALGGHSLLAVRVASRVRQLLHAEVGVTALFDHPVLAAFAAHVAAAARSALPPIVARSPAERLQPLPLSFAQQRLWFLSHMEGVGVAFHLPLGVRLTGPLRKDVLRRALDHILTRHEVLRTTFGCDEGEPVQRVGPATGAALSEHDLRDTRARAEALEQLVASEATTSFDLEVGPLIRGKLIALDVDDHVLLITLHHIIADGWSMGVLIRELSALYRAFSAGAPDPLPPLALQYSDYSAWQRRSLDGDVLQAQAAYWQRTLSGAPLLLQLPTDRPRPALQDHAGAFVPVVLDAALTARLKALAQRHGTTLFTTLLTGWAIVLARLSGQDDIMVGTPVANRGRAELEPLIGLFVNTLALRLDMAGSPSVAELLKRVKERTVAAQAHQDLPFEQVVERVSPARSAAHSPLFQVMFAWQNDEAGGLELPDLELAPVGAPVIATKYDVTLALSESADAAAGGVRGGFEYAAALFTDETIRRHRDLFERVLRLMAEDETQRVDRLALLDGAEQRRILDDWNATALPYPDVCLHQLIEHQVTTAPYAIALQAGPHALRYTEVNASANRVARRLRQLGVGPDARVALCVERGPEMVIGILAILKAGGAYVPLDPAYPRDRLAWMLEDCGSAVVLTQRDVCAVLPPTSAAMVLLDADPDVALDLDEPLSGHPESNIEPNAIGLDARHLAYVIYTSGSSGRPKGVMVEHRSLCNLALAQARSFGVRPGSRVLQFVSPSFDVCALDVAMTLASGACLHLATRAELAPGEPLLATLRRERITHAALPAAVLRALPVGDGLNGLDALETIVVGGEACPPETIVAWSAGRRVFNAYGPTEATVCASLHLCCGPVSGSVPIGRPIANTRIHILDAQRQPVPIGAVGEIHIGGVGVARGYLNQPALTAERFIDDPFTEGDGERLYRTGDLARYLPDGGIDYLGRNDDQLKLRGFRIEPGEIVARLMEHPCVRDAAVTVREAGSTSSDDADGKCLVAYYVPSDDVSLEALRDHLSSQLPDYMAPAAYVALPTLPLTPNGKLDYAALPSPGLQAFSSRVHESPQGETEIGLAAIWCELLLRERVGRHDNFFELGGHSLLVTKMLSRVQRDFEVEVPLHAFFRQPILTALARLVLQAQLTQFAQVDIQTLADDLQNDE